MVVTPVFEPDGLIQGTFLPTTVSIAVVSLQGLDQRLRVMVLFATGSLLRLQGTEASTWLTLLANLLHP